MYGAKVVMKEKEDEVKDITGNDDQRLFSDLVTGGVKTLELERSILKMAEYCTSL